LSSTTERRARREDEKGQILVLVAGGLVALLIVAALAFDAGMMLVERRDEQNAADAAALAGARYVLTDETAARNAARQIALDNGYDDTDASEVVNIYIPPIHGNPVYRTSGFIEVQIESTRPSIFGGIIGQAAWPVGAYAIATNAQNLAFPFSMLSLDPTGCQAILISGTGTVNAYGSIQANSDGSGCTPPDTTAFRIGGSGEVNVFADDATCRAVGGINPAGSTTITCDLAPNQFALPDPLRDLAAPALPPPPTTMAPVGHVLAPPGGCPGSSDPATEADPAECRPGGGTPSTTYRDKAWILYPGLYPGGIEVSNGAIAYLMPGIYWIGGGGLDVGGGGSIITIETESQAGATVAESPCVSVTALCGGVLIYNSQLPSSPGGPIILNSSAATMKLASFDAPSGDPDEIYDDIVIFQDRTMDLAGDDITLNGSASETVVEGIIYAPVGDVKLNGNGGTLTVDQIIAFTYQINGGGGTIDVLRNVGVDALITAAGLVE
jgi:hypothetical protein